MSSRLERSLRFALLVPAILAAAGAFAAQAPFRLPPETAQLAAGPGADLVTANCALCHSLDYITTQPPRRGNEFWQASVTKMIRVYGAPVAEADIPAIVAYLAAHY